MFSLNRQAMLGSSFSKAPITASAVSSISSQSSSGFSAGGTIIQQDFSFSLLDGFLNYKDQSVLYKMFREIYMLDAVCGPAIDQLSSLPWSSYSLLGIQDNAVLDLYHTCLSELNLVRLMTSMSCSYLVLGTVIGSLVFDKSRGIFSDCILYNPDDCELTPIPMIGYDPKVNVKVSKEMKTFLTSKDVRDAEARKEISEDLLKLLQSGKSIALEPLSTIVLSRSMLPGVQNLSYLSRILPIWIVEKALTRGTILASTQRQRGILHITMGSDEWDPTEDQQQAVAMMFANANRDPQGAIVVTRPDVNTSEIRSGSDFWSVTNERDGFTNVKLRALGLSESFGADTNYNSGDNSMTMFLENLRSFRESLTRSVLYDKVFLLLAKYHGFRKRTQAEIKHNVRYDTTSNHAARDEKTYKKAQVLGSRNMAEASSFQIPEIKWTKELQARGDSNALSLLQTAKELGLPLPISVIATYAGLPMPVLMDMLKEDVEARKKIKEYNDAVAKFKPKEEEGEGGVFGSSMYAKLRHSPVIPAKELAKVTDKDSLLSYLKYNMPPDVKITSVQAKQILKQANAIKPGLVKI